MKKILLIAALLFPGFANADVVSGVFQTEAGEDTGKWLHVQMAACADNPAQTCGTILRAFNADGSPDGANEHLGKQMVWAMDDLGGGKWGKGKIWAADVDKTYNSKMSLSGNTLTVEGCILWVCRGQTWSRVN